MSKLAEKLRRQHSFSGFRGAFVDGKSVNSKMTDAERAEIKQLEPLADAIAHVKRTTDTYSTPERWFADEEYYQSQCPLAVTHRDMKITPKEVLASGTLMLRPLMRIMGHPEYPGGERKVYRPADADLIQAGVFCHYCGTKQDEDRSSGVCYPVVNPATNDRPGSCGCPRGGKLALGRHDRLVQL